ncbi:MAG TPA: hypothetical protein VF297_03415 [Pyrinomonadaceae bacterium]
MKVRVPILIKDQATQREYEIERAIQSFIIDKEEFFLDGPVSKRVAILDFDPKTGALRPGARFVPPTKGRKVGSYAIRSTDNITAHDFTQVSIFGTVIKMMYMFEEEDALGRPLEWAFDAPQLLVIPRAGEWANAFYERESHSLQFFFFKSEENPRKTVYASHSQDIIAHETGHAILDGIAPDLYNSVTPQSLALHESIADMTALMSAFRTSNLTTPALQLTRGSITDSRVFSGIAGEFGRNRAPEDGAAFLRELNNRKTLNPRDRTKDRYGRPNLVTRDEPHALSEVLSGALYALMVDIYEREKKRFAPTARRKNWDDLKLWVFSLWTAAQKFKRIIFRALDYLPPGEVSFADYGRAIIAADQASHPDEGQERKFIAKEFVRRHMAPNLKALEIKTNFQHAALEDVDLEVLLNSDWAAYEFANRNRDFLRVPKHVRHFRVWPRLDTTKVYYQGADQKQRIRECIFKVAWDHEEPNKVGALFPRRRQVTLGTTLAIDWETRTVRALLSTDGSAEQRGDRDRLVMRLADEGLLRIGSEAIGPNGKMLRTAIRAEITEGLMRMRGAARMLHIAEVR